MDIKIKSWLFVLILSAFSVGCGTSEKATQTHGWIKTYSGTEGNIFFKVFAGTPTLSQRIIDSLNNDKNIAFSPYWDRDKSVDTTIVTYTDTLIVIEVK